MPTDPPPSYDETLISDLSEETKEEIRAAVITELNKPETTIKIVEEVSELANKTAEIQSLFQEILVSLGQFTYTGVNFRDKWETIYEDFRALLKTSIKEATIASALIDKFVDTVIPVMKSVKGEDDEKHMKVAIKLAQKFLKDCDDTMVDAGRTDPIDRIHKIATTESEAFKEFEKKITDFQVEFTSYVEGYKGRVAAEVQVIQILQSEIESIRNKLSWLELGIMGAAILTGVIGASVVIMAAFPVVGKIILGLSVIALGLQSFAHNKLSAELREKEDQLTEAKNKLARLGEEQTTALNLKAHLATEKGPLLNIIANINSFGAFWDTIVVDAKKLHKILKDISEQEPDQFTEFQTYLTRSEAYYKPIQAGLQAYITHDMLTNFGQ
ncbi:transmembrane protein, putative [Rhizoctonia solani AG-3 Rhs1AP]|uniref:Transmembrane protein, putative n=2 Tax=Rhizoctonia solani AG-3 TaxID=1086053 RepID=X8IU07_9AGAM|nr:transmembrane protein, putative [Rhizoctonia solani AG-3 Rhs1AP]KEP47186.1 putative transmembrane protein [Rhizoctonia solani 123E]